MNMLGEYKRTRELLGASLTEKWLKGEGVDSDGLVDIVDRILHGHKAKHRNQQAHGLAKRAKARKVRKARNKRKK